MYTSPVDDILFTLKHIAGLEGDASVDADIADAVITEAGRFCDATIAPAAARGDKEGSRLSNGEVRSPTGWPEIYRAWAAAGWNGLAAPVEIGGQGLPHRLQIAAMEIWNGGSMAFALAPMLTAGAAEALATHGSDSLKARFLPKMVSGEWTGTMNLTEPHAGSDLATLRTRAERRDDGTYRIFGQKIYITWGEHDFTDNIVHLVLARLADAPEGTRGISLFLVPKFLLNEDGSLGARNDLFCHSIEEKLGIHASPTCTMIYGDGRFGAEAGAIGYLIGEENRGLACMFTMMNNARLAVGAQGVAMAEAATQAALAYARERRQGKAPGSATASPIIDHPDIARTLLTMKALTQGARAITYLCAEAVDRAHQAGAHADETRASETGASETRASETGASTSGVSQGGHDQAGKRHWQDRAALLTPIAKSFPTDVGVEVASLGIQVHGGMGFVEETGAARLLRDARIAPIYEGTNGIQAIDLVTRKLPLGDGAHVRGLIAELQATIDALPTDVDGPWGTTASRLGAAVGTLSEATTWLLSELAAGRPAAALAGATAYQRLFGLVLSGLLLAKGAASDAEDGRQAQRVALARFFAENLLGETAFLADAILHGADSLAAARIALN
ncbi:acyl-CoA dehydrogenase [Rhizobium sp. Leaf384]|uniref:acyl-CoA dehydrogenase n=1 Tax=unclassified Rhizobium TaxID=2613769 RepID=UPI00071522CD|nr:MULTISPECIES: acyl-CoA dehydrogenase [unclassified Rhizobium]KQS77362.1 acyl-CoA dehydrogenase [Rhizobium sp. Leaf383]KQS80730.1 acyl-CoA dehydrogenase [Rhizobium sp. Leaf384]